MKDIREQNAKVNSLRREADKHKIGSPYRIDEYIKYRMKGYSEKKALEKIK